MTVPKWYSLSFFTFASDGSYAPFVTFQRLWKWLPKRQTGMGDFSLGMPDTSDTYLTIPHMVSDHNPLPNFLSPGPT
jgi:hypothetical protein